MTAEPRHNAGRGGEHEQRRMWALEKQESLRRTRARTRKLKPRGLQQPVAPKADARRIPERGAPQVIKARQPKPKQPPNFRAAPDRDLYNSPKGLGTPRPLKDVVKRVMEAKLKAKPPPPLPSNEVKTDTQKKLDKNANQIAKSCSRSRTLLRLSGATTLKRR